MSMMPVGAARLEVLDEGSGEPVVFIQTALTADELSPLADRLRDRFRTILYHRRGYGTDAPEYVHSLTLVEPPPVHVASAPEFRAANERLVAARHARGPESALEEFLTLVIGRHWRRYMERLVPGSAEQTRRDAHTFFDTDLPALLAWQFSAQDAHRIRCPVLHVGGTDSGPWLAEVRQLVLDWFPDAEDVVRRRPLAGHHPHRRGRRGPHLVPATPPDVLKRRAVRIMAGGASLAAHGHVVANPGRVAERASRRRDLQSRSAMMLPVSRPRG